MTEFLLPTNPRYFDSHRILDVLDFYDGPKIYTFYTASSDFFLAYYADDDGTCEEWIFTPTSESTINRLVKNEISIRLFFKLSDVSYLAKVMKGSVAEVRKKYFSEIESEYIPEDGIFLDCSATLISVRLVKEGISPRNTSESIVGNVVSNVRKLFKEAMRILREENSSYNIFPATPEFSYNSILAGSVNIVLKPIRKNPLIEKAAAAIEKVVSGDYTNISEKLVERIERSLIPLAPNSNSRVYGFDSIEFGGVFASESSMRRLSFSLTSIKREDLQKKYGFSLLTKSVTLTGLVDEGSTRAEEFTLRNLENNDLQILEAKCRFDSEDIDIQGEIEEAATWAFMKISSTGKKLRVSGDYDMKERVITVQSIQVQ